MNQVRSIKLGTTHTSTKELQKEISEEAVVDQALQADQAPLAAVVGVTQALATAPIKVTEKLIIKNILKRPIATEVTAGIIMTTMMIIMATIQHTLAAVVVVQLVKLY